LSSQGKKKTTQAGNHSFKLPLEIKSYRGGNNKKKHVCRLPAISVPYCCLSTQQQLTSSSFVSVFIAGNLKIDMVILMFSSFSYCILLVRTKVKYAC